MLAILASPAPPLGRQTWETESGARGESPAQLASIRGYVSSVDKAGQTVDFFLSRQRDVNAAKAFLRKALKGQRLPTKITLDAYAASHRALSDLKQSGELPSRVLVRTSKYLNNLIEQDHRRVKQRLGPMLGLKSFRTAAVVIGGIELAEKIKKGQFKIGKLGGRTATMPEVWQAALAA
jgi:transposase-like protein